MKRLSARDASILALVAERRGMSPNMLKRVLSETDSRSVKSLVRVLNARRESSRKGSGANADAVEGLELWAERNRLVHAPPVRGKKR